MAETNLELEPVRNVREDWSKGDVIGMMVDFRPRTPDHRFGRSLHFFKNGRWMESCNLPSDVGLLWPAVKLYGTGDTVGLQRVAPFVLPEEFHAEIEKQLGPA